MKNLVWLALAVSFILTVHQSLTSGQSALQAAAGGESDCAQTSLRGVYIYNADGFSIDGEDASQRTPFAWSGKDYYDGKGKFTGSYTASDNGLTVRGSYRGTYVLRPDCTGDGVYVDDESGETAHFDLFAEPSGEQFTWIGTDAGFISSGWSKRPSTRFPVF